MDQTPNLQLDYLLPNQAQKHATVNENARHLDAIVRICAESGTFSAPLEMSSLPDASAAGPGSLAFVSDALGGGRFAYRRREHLALDGRWRERGMMRAPNSVEFLSGDD